MVKWIRKDLCTSSFSEVTESKDLHIIDVRDLVDKRGNSRNIIRTKINDALNSLKMGKKVAICCDYGISRSNSIAAGVLALSEEISMNDAIRTVLKKTGEKSIKIDVLSTVIGVIEKKKLKKKNNRLRVVITGSTGFLGKKIMSEFKKEFEIFTPNRNQIDLINDIVDLDLFVKDNQIDLIIHTANPRIYSTNQSMGNSLIMLKNVLDVCVENKLSLIYLSGWEIYSGYKKNKMIIKENTIPNPGSTYGYTKFLSESLIKMYHKNFKLKYTIIRSSPIYGIDGDKPKFIWNFLEKAVKNENILTHKYHNGYPKLDLLYVDDLVSAIKEIVKKRINGSINIGSGTSISTKEVAEKIVKKMRSKSKIEHVEIDDSVSNIILNTNLAKKIIRWEPKVSIDDGLQLMINTKLDNIK
ncbi:MAG: NAD(P)-dependent oxidoreductase [Crenarchaeota archaeon]|nr:MAG: NAD(P)-dependent oxidoreductase [Thermoproteota archaeon]RDJ33343.1 MAG: NAD(P)-dependent oxidoreductase [Thermoproteota archaeon]RDJ36154.1 MAG: NAD(P)-dependent oxidoreductase [Thermoproteota archaeon]RDJ38786.1 MAG: NAD(P)-dependent oxidoreductase [Thermoproteota archaeon]